MLVLKSFFFSVSTFLFTALLSDGRVLPSHNLFKPTAFSSINAVKDDAPSWQQYIKGVTSNIVRPVAILPGSVTGGVTNPENLLTSGGSSTQFLASTSSNSQTWPSGTIANASSVHAPNSAADGTPRTYSASNAIDGSATTFWNDDTAGQYPDILTVISPSPVSMTGITIISHADGVPIDMLVEYLEADSTWIQGGSVTGNSAVQINVPFSSTVSTRMVRITVTKAQSTPAGEFSRIVQVIPGLMGSATPSLVLDFGKVVVGFLNIAFAGASDNKPGMRLAFSETLQFLSTTSDFTRSQNGATITPGTDQIAVESAAYTWQDNYGCEYGNKVCADGLHGFRYVRLTLDALASDAPYTSSSGSVNIDSVWLNFTAFVGTPSSYSSWFESSDADLNKYFYEASYTNELCIDTHRRNDTDPRNSFSESLDGKLVLLDGTKRDRDPYIGDIAISGLTTHLTHSSASIAVKNVLADLAQQQRSDGFIPPASIFNYGLTLYDYPLWWVTSLHDYLLYNNDPPFAQTMYPTLLKLLDTYYPSTTSPTTNLLTKGLGPSTNYGDYAFIPRTGTVTYYNALYVLALQNAAVIASALNHPTDSTRWLARAQTVSDAVNAHLWDDATGAYWDTLEAKATHAQDGNSLAVVSGLAPSDRATRLLKYWASLALPYGNPFYASNALGGGYSSRVYAFISTFELRARFVNDQGDSAIEELKRLYGWMSARGPGTTYWEGVGAGGGMYEAGFTSAAHGWSTGVVGVLMEFVLGVKSTDLGWKRWSVRPVVAGGVGSARGEVGKGEGGAALGVDWTSGTAGSNAFNLSVSVPNGTEGVVSVPVAGGGGTGSVSVNGEVVWTMGKGSRHNATYADGYVSLDITEGGDWAFVVAA